MGGAATGGFRLLLLFSEVVGGLRGRTRWTVTVSRAAAMSRAAAGLSMSSGADAGRVRAAGVDIPTAPPLEPAPPDSFRPFPAPHATGVAPPGAFSAAATLSATAAATAASILLAHMASARAICLASAAVEANEPPPSRERHSPMLFLSVHTAWSQSPTACSASSNCASAARFFFAIVLK